MTEKEQAAMEQRHRDAAGAAYDAIAGCTVPLNFGKRVRAGEESELAQAFANFEASHRPEWQETAYDAGLKDAISVQASLRATDGAEVVAWMYVYTVQYQKKLECTPKPDPVYKLSSDRWDTVPKHWTETPLYAHPPATPIAEDRAPKQSGWVNAGGGEIEWRADVAEDRAQGGVEALRAALEAIICEDRLSKCPCDEWVETDPMQDGPFAKTARAALSSAPDAWTERAVIVAWLRSAVSGANALGLTITAKEHEIIASAIERGDHLPTAPDAGRAG